MLSNTATIRTVDIKWNRQMQEQASGVLDDWDL